MAAREYAPHPSAPFLWATDEPVPGVGRACHELHVMAPNLSGADHPTFLRAGSRGRP